MSSAAGGIGTDRLSLLLPSPSSNLVVLCVPLLESLLCLRPSRGRAEVGPSGDDDADGDERAHDHVDSSKTGVVVGRLEAWRAIWPEEEGESKEEWGEEVGGVQCQLGRRLGQRRRLVKEGDERPIPRQSSPCLQAGTAG